MSIVVPSAYTRVSDDALRVYYRVRCSCISCDQCNQQVGLFTVCPTCGTSAAEAQWNRCICGQLVHTCSISRHTKVTEFSVPTEFATYMHENEGDVI